MPESSTATNACRRGVVARATHGARFLGEDPARVRGRELLTTLSDEMRAAAVVFVLDPTLAQEPNSPRWRSLDLLIELSRQLPYLLQQASDTRYLTSGDVIPQRWAEALALHERALEIARSIPELVPRPEPTTPHGQRAISTERLAPHRSAIAEAAALVRDAIELALATTHPDPTAVELDHIARRLERIAIEIDGHEVPDVLPRSGTQHT
ncbi:hypothetical protein ACTD5D_40785 [Nocardia takedensis]|uniref:hypothetical protein n=1 Tax=Nocardia takedensis TaxID=259390 RepID=UPI003F764472